MALTHLDGVHKGLIQWHMWYDPPKEIALKRESLIEQTLWAAEQYPSLTQFLFVNLGLN